MPALDLDHIERGTYLQSPTGRRHYVSDFDHDDRGTYLWLLPEGGTRRRRLYQDQTDGGWTVDSSDPATPAVEARPAAVPAPALTLPNPHDPNAFVEYRAEQCRKCDAMGPWVNWDDKMTDPNVTWGHSHLAEHPGHDRVYMWTITRAIGQNRF